MLNEFYVTLWSFKASMVTNHLCQRVRLIFGPILFWHFCFLRYSRCLLNILTVQGGEPDDRQK